MSLSRTLLAYTRPPDAYSVKVWAGWLSAGGGAASVASVASVASSDAAGTSGLSVDTEILDGHPADRLVAQADGDGGLIVVGSRGYGPLGAVLVGSVAAEVLREATSPVIVVPRSA